jgi:hypothetical protein
MKLIAALSLVPVLALGGDINGGELSWLVGCWTTTDSRAKEVWVVDSENSLAGFAVAVDDDKVGFYEVLSIKQNEDGSWIYTAHPSGQASASFVAVEITANSVVFANPDHDYPQEISYTREENRLYAKISLLGGVNPSSFDKVACK